MNADEAIRILESIKLGTNGKNIREALNIAVECIKRCRDFMDDWDNEEDPEP